MYSTPYTLNQAPFSYYLLPASATYSTPLLSGVGFVYLISATNLHFLHKVASVSHN